MLHSVSQRSETDIVAVTSFIGERVRSERLARGWTLNELAARSGISRRMLINVEQGATNPSIATLLRLSDALGLGLPALIDMGGVGPTRVHRSGDASPVWRSANGGSAIMVAGTEPPDVVELWDWILGPGDAYESEPHASGTRELLLVLEGVVRVQAGTDEETLHTGDSADFASDRPHAYVNGSPRRRARFALTVFQPGVGSEARR
jgi:transcriptional regulator with XRE-family HTH domain